MYILKNKSHIFLYTNYGHIQYFKYYECENKNYNYSLHKHFYNFGSDVFPKLFFNIISKKNKHYSQSEMYHTSSDISYIFKFVVLE